MTAFRHPRNRVDYTIQCARLKALFEQWELQPIIAEQNRVGQQIIEQLGRDGLRIQQFKLNILKKIAQFG